LCITPRLYWESGQPSPAAAIPLESLIVVLGHPDTGEISGSKLELGIGFTLIGFPDELLHLF
jgi:hypothetical protein